MSKTKDEDLELLSEYIRMRFGIKENEPSLVQSLEIYNRISSGEDEELIIKQMFPLTFGTCKYGTKVNVDLRRAISNLRSKILR